MTYGRLAQLVEHLLDVQEVTGSSPVPSTTKILRLLSEDFLFMAGRIGREQQRQGITMTVVSCLLFCGIKVALCELDRHLYGALMAIAAYVRTGSLYTSGKV